MAIEGWLEQVTEHYAAGWAYDPQNPGTRLTVSIHRGDREIGEARCELFRPDLYEGQLGKGDHGFTFNFIPPLSAADTGSVWASIRGEALPVLAPLPPRQAHVSAQAARALAPGFLPSRSDGPERVDYPIFVLGAARSGTTAMAAALANNRKYVGFEEGQFFDIVLSLTSAITDFYERKQEDVGFIGTMINNVPLDYFEERIFAAIRKLANQLFSSAHWVDKTPNLDIVRSADILHRIWPEAKFIYMKRRGIENVMSRLRKFPTWSFRDHCIDWTEIMRVWDEKKSHLAGRYIEIDQREMLLDPKRIARRVGLFLDLEEDETESLGAYLQHVHPQRTATDYFEILALTETGWSSDQIAMFRDICGATMRRFGYGFDRSYYKNLALEPQG